ncbi:MAG: hypothetical protein CM1200mP2_59720 [Planctomycetaceae bacterium]|nr:MAG: hypothetical protein CM1200mP2_59720 [Planctomycetaceae bacterium]
MTRWCRWPGPGAGQGGEAAPKHHVKMPTNHYTGIVLLPSMCQLIAKQVKTLKARKR